MSLQADIKTILAANSNLTALVSTRIYPVIAPEKPTLPLLVYNLEGLTPTQYKAGSIPWDDCTVSVTAIAKNMADVETIAQHVRTAMNGYSGTISSDKIKSLTLTNQSWQPVELVEASSTSGYVAYAVVTTFNMATEQNISE